MSHHPEELCGGIMSNTVTYNTTVGNCSSCETVGSALTSAQRFLPDLVGYVAMTTFV
ncbi:4794_t:CDS:2 [Diversispora eburnea]|uniref:4794_t:CDS:1 n=1 Tax=Diversispora eburnea TaxID=1213867 RepID=A0A9N9B492_9GLOM|nr:4794_t:CDS:2 [Diversispora eburnea]